MDKSQKALISRFVTPGRWGIIDPMLQQSKDYFPELRAPIREIDAALAAYRRGALDFSTVKPLIDRVSRAVESEPRIPAESLDKLRERLADLSTLAAALRPHDERLIGTPLMTLHGLLNECCAHGAIRLHAFPCDDWPALRKAS